MINKKELPSNQRVYINSLGKRLNEAISPAISQVSAKKDVLSSEE
jgi:hypothetical protein